MTSKASDDDIDATDKSSPAPEEPPSPERAPETVARSESEWRAVLTPAQYHVLRERGTERAFSYPDAPSHEAPASFRCAGCGQLLFSAQQKYDSGSGWPSFYAPADASAVQTAEDGSHGMSRIEVHCARCQGHLGHVFNDGPAPTGLRYCINSLSLKPMPGTGANEPSSKK